MEKRNVVILLVLVVFGAIGGYWIYNSISHPIPLTPASQIYIRGNEALDSYPHKTGSGTNDDPYVIEYFQFEDAESIQIQIINTDRNLEIRNCEIENARLAGIYLEKCQNIKITNSFFSKSFFGIYFIDSSQISFTNNTLIHNEHAINLKNVSNASIVQNTMIDNRQIDINGINVIDCLIKQKLISNTSSLLNTGVSISGSDIMISNNTINNALDNGILIDSVSNLIMGNNTFDNCSINFGEFVSQTTLSTCSIDSTNLVNGKPLYYYYMHQNLNYANFSNAGQIILAYCSNVNIANQNISISLKAISLIASFNIVIYNN